MNRRSFLKLTGASVLFYGCEGGTEPLASIPIEDGGTLVQDAGAIDSGVLDAGAIDAGVAIVVAEGFDVVLNDTLCSRHSHAAHVDAGEYPPNQEVRYLGGSHELIFTGLEIAQLQNGERIPFATVGGGPGHGHCGMAWRREVGREDPTRRDMCTVRGTAMCIA